MLFVQPQKNVLGLHIFPGERGHLKNAKVPLKAYLSKL